MFDDFEKCRSWIERRSSQECCRGPLLLKPADDGYVELVHVFLDTGAAVDGNARYKAIVDNDNDIGDQPTPLHVSTWK